MFALRQNYLRRELLAGEIINKKLSFWNHSLAFPWLSCLGSGFGNLVAFDLHNFINVRHLWQAWELKPGSCCRNPSMNSTLMGCPSILELLLQIRKIRGMSDFGKFFLSISSIFSSVFAQSAKWHSSLAGCDVHPIFLFSPIQKASISAIPETFTWLIF